MTLEAYERALSGPRSQFASQRVVEELINADVDPGLLELFLIEFSALGRFMTEPVEGWIQRAGQRCAALGLPDLGRALQGHARQEAGHHLLMLDDTRALVLRWNARCRPLLDVETLLRQPPSEGIRGYRQLHEDVIAGDAPFAQLAIEYEIEMLSVRFGPRLIEQCVRLLGRPVLEGLSFLREHVELDVSHTGFNRRQLERLLAQEPRCVAPLAAAGTAALTAYGRFLEDCLLAAEEALSGVVASAAS